LHGPCRSDEFFCCSGWVRSAIYGLDLDLENFPLNIKFFNLFPFGSKKSLGVSLKAGRPLIYCRSKVCSCQGPSLPCRQLAWIPLDGLQELGYQTLPATQKDDDYLQLGAILRESNYLNWNNSQYFNGIYAGRIKDTLHMNMQGRLGPCGNFMWFVCGEVIVRGVHRLFTKHVVFEALKINSNFCEIWIQKFNRVTSSETWIPCRQSALKKKPVKRRIIQNFSFEILSTEKSAGLFIFFRRRCS